MSDCEIISTNKDLSLRKKNSQNKNLETNYFKGYVTHLKMEFYTQHFTDTNYWFVQVQNYVF